MATSLTLLDLSRPGHWLIALFVGAALLYLAVQAVRGDLADGGGR